MSKAKGKSIIIYHSYFCFFSYFSLSNIFLLLFLVAPSDPVATMVPLEIEEGGEPSNDRKASCKDILMNLELAVT